MKKHWFFGVLIICLLCAGYFGLFGLEYPSPRLTGNIPLVKQWEFAADSDIRVVTVISDEIVLVRTDDALLRIAPTDGKLLWAFPITSSFATTQAAELKGRIYIANQLNLVALDEETGQLIWSVELSGAKEDPTVMISECCVYVSGLYVAPGPQVMAFSAETGEFLWSKVGIFQPEFVNDAVVHLIERDELFTLDGLTGEILFRKKLGYIISADFSNEILYLWKADNEVIAVDVNTHNILWRKTLVDKTISVDLKVQSRYLVAAASDLSLLDAHTGQLFWKKEGFGVYHPTIFQGNLYVSDVNSQEVHILNLESGEWIGKIKYGTRRFTFSKETPGIAASARWLLIYTSDKVYAYRK